MIVSVDLVKLNLKTAPKYMAHIAEVEAMIQKGGGTVLGSFFVEAGGSGGEVVFMTKWGGFDARWEGMHKVLHDTESLELHNKLVKCVESVQNYLCVPNPKVDIDKFNVTRKSALHMYRCRMGDPMATESAKMYMEFQKLFQESGDWHVTLDALLVPIAFDGGISLLALHQVAEGGFDKALQSGMHTIKKHGKPTKDLLDHLEMVSNRILTPIDEKMMEVFRALGEKKKEKKGKKKEDSDEETEKKCKGSDEEKEKKKTEEKED